MNSEETNIVRRIMLKLSAIPGVRIFRNNTGTGWAGQSIQMKNGDRLVKNPFLLRAGLCVGSSDLIGFRSVVVTPEMVGKKIAIFAACEVKTKTGKATDEQINFVEMINRNGGIAMIVTNEEEAFELIGKKI